MERLVLQTRNHALITIGVMTVALTLMVFFITRTSISRPMETLTKGAESIGQGRFDTRIPVTTADEISLLSHAFNEMAERLAEKAALEQQIRHAEKLAAIGQLAAGIAHEIGTPLNVISGNAEYLLMDMAEDDPRTVELKAIIAEVDRITRLIRQLLNFARHREARRTEVNINGLIEETFILITHQIEKRKIELSLSLASDLPPIYGDAEHLKQVFLNLAMNACQAMSESGRLSVSTRLTVDNRIEITFTDTGHGIPRDDLERIFDPFFTTKEPGEGTGLGLTISRRILEDHGGRVSVTSDPNLGSTFIVRLPAVASKRE
jgi:signal transduction histidine kinase